MKIHFDIDATPSELREFLGLPDIRPLQKEMLEKMREKMLQGVGGFDPQAIMKPFLPPQLQSAEAWQKFLLDAFRSATSNPDRGQ